MYYRKLYCGYKICLYDYYQNSAKNLIVDRSECPMRFLAKPCPL